MNFARGKELKSEKSDSTESPKPMPKYKKKPSLSKRPGSFGKAFGKSTLSIAKGLLQMLNLLKVFPFQRTPLQTRTTAPKKTVSKRPGRFGKAFGKNTLSITKGPPQVLNLLKVLPFQRTPLQTRTKNIL